MSTQFDLFGNPVRAEPDFTPPEPGRWIQSYLWSRTILCESCTALIPLSPNWRLSDEQGLGMQVTPVADGTPAFAVVDKRKISLGTVGNGVARCLHCGASQHKGYPAEEAEAGRMGHLLYGYVVKVRTVAYNKRGRPVRDRMWLEYHVADSVLLSAHEQRREMLASKGIAVDPYLETDPLLLGLGLFGGVESELAIGMSLVPPDPDEDD